MAFYFARIWLTDSAAKLVLIAAVLVAKISAANNLTRINSLSTVFLDFEIILYTVYYYSNLSKQVVADSYVAATKIFKF